MEVVGVETPKDAVIESDLIVTSGPILKHPAPSIEAGWLRPGAFASAVDFDSYWTGAALAESSPTTGRRLFTSPARLRSPRGRPRVESGISCLSQAI